MRGLMAHFPRHGSSSMGRNILKYGVIAGLVVAAGMWGTLLAFGGDMPHGWFGLALGYLSMLVALSAVFVGIKRHRDVDRGGVIGFGPAFGVGRGISLVAGVFYVLACELAQATVAGGLASYYATEATAPAPPAAPAPAGRADTGGPLGAFHTG